MTTLYNGNTGGGNIALLDDWTSYDMLVVQITNDSRANVSTYYYPVWNLKLGIDLMNSTGKEGVGLAWGYKTSITGNGITTISLPCAFQSSTSFVVIATLRRGDSSGSGVDSIYTYPNSATSFKVVHDYTSSSNPDGVYWLAIGI